MANHRGVRLCKAKGQYTENRTVNVRMSRTLFTDLYTQALLYFLVDSFSHCYDSVFVELFNLVFHHGLES